MESKIKSIIQNKKICDGDYLADAIIDLCFVTSYKIKELIKMPPKRLERLLCRFNERFKDGVSLNG